MTESYPFVHGEHHGFEHSVHSSRHGASYHMYLQVPINSNKICPLGKHINMYSGHPPLYRLLQSGTLRRPANSTGYILSHFHPLGPLGTRPLQFSTIPENPFLAGLTFLVHLAPATSPSPFSPLSTP
jgi:hypothetical protein